MKKVVELLQQLNAKSGIDIVFSGLNAHGKKIITRNEALAMDKFFRELVDNATFSCKIKRVATDEASHSTKNNIAQFLSSKPVRKAVTAKQSKPINVIIISSTFHLVRLAFAFQEQLKTPEMIETKEKIKRIILIGAKVS